MNTYRVTLKSGIYADFTAENDEELNKKLSRGHRGILPIGGKLHEMITPESVEKIELVEEETHNLK